jgi:lysophospholipase L1-like esterase
MSEEKTENRFIRFFERNRRIFLPFKYFVYLTGIVVIVLFILDFGCQAFLEGISLKENQKLLEEDQKISIENYHYEPYLDFSCSSRNTKNPCKDISEDPLIIYAFGGSTMWGVETEEDETIASYISELLCENGIPVEVKNFGIPAYVSTQEIIEFFLELGDDKIPDIVIFYDGANDINSRGYGYKTPQAFRYFFQRLDYRTGAFPSLREYLGRRFGGTNLSIIPKEDILDSYLSNFQLRTDNLSDEELYEKVMEIYLNNVKTVKSMEKDWSFKSFFYWQPTLYDKINSLSEEEEMLSFFVEYSVALQIFKQFKVADPIITKFLNNNKHIKDLRGIFSNRSDTVFTDWCHVLPENNKIIAKEVVKDIVKYLEESNYYE